METRTILLCALLACAGCAPRAGSEPSVQKREISDPIGEKAETLLRARKGEAPCSSVEACAERLHNIARGKPVAENPGALNYPDERQKIIEELALCQMEREGGVLFDPLLPLLTDPDPGVVDTAAAAIALTMWKRAMPFKVGRDGRPEEREVSLADGARARAVDALILQLHRGGTVPWALGWLEDPRAGQALADHFIKTGDAGAASALGRIGASAHPIAIRILESYPTWSADVVTAVLETADDPARLLDRMETASRDRSRSAAVRANAAQVVLNLVGRGVGSVGASRRLRGADISRAASVFTSLADSQSCEPLRTALSSMQYWERAGAMLHTIPVWGSAAACTAEALEAAAEEQDRFINEAAVAALSFIRVESSAPVLIAVLESPNWKNQLWAVIGLGWLGQAGRSALSRLAEIESTHWSSVVRARAAEARRQIRGATPIPPHDPSAVGEFRRVLYEQLGETEREPCGDRAKRDLGIRQVSRAALPPGKRPPLKGVSEEQWASLALQILQVRGGWMVGYDHGEWGGSLSFVSPGGESKDLVSDDNIRAIVDTSMGTVAVAGLGHLSLDHGRLYRISRGTGEWEAQMLLELPARPRWIGLDPAENLVVDTSYGTFRVSKTAELIPLHCQ